MTSKLLRFPANTLNRRSGDDETLSLWHPMPKTLNKKGPTPSAVVTMERVSKAFGSLQVVEKFSLVIERGEGVTLWGSNGTGKTTLLRLVMGLLAPDEGTVLVDGADPRAEPITSRRRVGYVPQKVSFPPFLTVAEVWDFYAACRGVSRQEQQERAQELGISEWMNRRVEHLSGGMNQRVALAIATLGSPVLLVLDEPGANLDRASLERFLEVVQILKAQGTAVLLATHDVREMDAFGDRVMHWEDGIWREGEPAAWGAVRGG